MNKILFGDCLDKIKNIPPGSVDAVLTDPPYPNNAGHFDDSINTAIEFLKTFKCNLFIVFWHELKRPPVDLPFVALHIWHRSNTNKPNNYESIYVFNADGIKRASRVMRHPVIYQGLTGCKEATGHPTQKPVSLIVDLLKMHTKKNNLILDPFSGSGTTAIACHKLGRRFVCIEDDKKYYDISIKRLKEIEAQQELFK